LQPLVTGWALLETSLGAVARLRNFEAETEQENKPDENIEPPSNWPQRGEIVFRNLIAGYRYVTFALGQTFSQY
jgi:ATP-binding cassette subfamily C (CFTR/MRP) protein 1